MECVASLSSPPPSCSLQASSPHKGASLLHTHRTCCALMKSFVCLAHLDKEAAFAKLVEMNPKINDENWQRERRRESEELRMRRELEDKEEAQKTENYREISKRMEGYDEEAVKEAKALVASFIKAGENVEEKIQEAADNGQLKKLVLLVIFNRLELARHDNERHIVQALDLLYRRIEAEILRREATPSIQFLDELLNLQDGCSHEDWLRRCRQSMIQTFPREDALSFLAPSGFDLRNTSSHQLQIETSRFRGVLAEAKICHLCRLEPEQSCTMCVTAQCTMRLASEQPEEQPSQQILDPTHTRGTMIDRAIELGRSRRPRLRGDFIASTEATAEDPLDMRA
ncbi:hypothetical protein L7F22_056949 [Adiantum nelumboides]|nr:hypothetical protein [Adiantum nelumboides]